MRVITILMFLIIGRPSFGQQFSYPIFNKLGRAIRDFIPPNWFLKDSSAGDLNDDNIPDLAFVIECKDTINEVRPDSPINRGSPRILLILFKNKNSGFYDLVLQNNTFIIRNGEGGMDPEAFGKLSISQGILSVEFDFSRGFSRYKFRYQKEDFYQIGAISNGVAGGNLPAWTLTSLLRKQKKQPETFKVKMKKLVGKIFHYPIR